MASILWVNSKSPRGLFVTKSKNFSSRPSGHSKLFVIITETNVGHSAIPSFNASSAWALLANKLLLKSIFCRLLFFGKLLAKAVIPKGPISFPLKSRSSILHSGKAIHFPIASTPLSPILQYFNESLRSVWQWPWLISPRTPSSPMPWLKSSSKTHKDCEAANARPNALHPLTPRFSLM